MPPGFNVIIPYFQQGQFIERTIRSLTSQSDWSSQPFSLNQV